jgi:hypothetical protein
LSEVTGFWIEKMEIAVQKGNPWRIRLLLIQLSLLALLMIELFVKSLTYMERKRSGRICNKVLIAVISEQ